MREPESKLGLPAAGSAPAITTSGFAPAIITSGSAPAIITSTTSPSSDIEMKNVDNLFVKLNKLETSFKIPSKFEDPGKLELELLEVENEIQLAAQSAELQFLTVNEWVSLKQKQIGFLIEDIMDSNIKSEVKARYQSIPKLYSVNSNGLSMNPSKNNSHYEVLSNDSLEKIARISVIQGTLVEIEDSLLLTYRNFGYRKTLITVILIVQTFAVMVSIYFLGLQRLSLRDSIPLLSVPWAVVIFSLLGSQISMANNLLIKSSVSFNSSLNWLIFRPLGGVLLGSVIYLLVSSFTNLIFSSSPNNDNILNAVDKLILVACLFVSSNNTVVGKFLDLVVGNISLDTQEFLPSPKKADEHKKK